jgi:hypothetical protein
MHAIEYYSIVWMMIVMNVIMLNLHGQQLVMCFLEGKLLICYGSIS